MSEDESDQARPILDPARARLLKRVGMVLSGLMLLMFGMISFFVIRAELAHDEQDCPFQPATERKLKGGLVVAEHMRSCLPDVQERLWTLQRPGEAPRELGRRRLSAELFDEDRYRWTLRFDDDEKVVLRIENEGAPPTEFHEVQLLPPQ